MQANKVKKTCTICGKCIFKLARHINITHPGISNRELFHAIISQRKLRKDCRIKIQFSRSFRICDQRKINGELCKAIVLKHGLSRHLSIRHGIKVTSEEGKIIRTKIDRHPIVIIQEENGSNQNDDVRVVDDGTNVEVAQKNYMMNDEIPPSIPEVPILPNIFHIELEYNDFEMWLKYEKHFEILICRMHMKTISRSWFQLETFDGNFEEYLRHIKEQLPTRSYEKKLTALTLLNEFWGKKKEKVLWYNTE